MNETFTGGIGSYLLFCLILTFLREIRKEYRYYNKLNELENVTLSEYLIKFFEFYGVN